MTQSPAVMMKQAVMCAVAPTEHRKRMAKTTPPPSLQAAAARFETR
jgi:hypothetical protein